ncbi:MAG: bifunctional DNA-formamidopyrimidine glycosylase/DNA-(apurinic or apyrimidinic site) lyase [Gammaproteobacteria bacterium]|nr:bifunctional DNA-formamidopyrimidine glycosylase/DNA-(apurinic or apyrimidinic site) lyase [Gammaproteobacteria bacterium]
MPELPEVETTRRGVAPHLVGRSVSGVTVRDPRLRWPVPAGLAALLAGQQLLAVDRRAKYLLFRFGAGTMLVHLGMSGSLRLVDAGASPGPHDHVDIAFGDRVLRLRDPRRFGSVHWVGGDAGAHPLLARLGPEPLHAAFGTEWLHAQARRRRVTAKALLMDGHVVVGVGNIYANEALFRAGVRPTRRSNRLTRADCERLVTAVKAVLTEAIRHGGTTLRDFVREDGQPGYFRIELMAYGRGGEPCPRCGTAMKASRLGQRATVYCPRCQR